MQFHILTKYGDLEALVNDNYSARQRSRDQPHQHDEPRHRPENPNPGSATNTWPPYVTSAAQIQVDTGFNSFTELPAKVAAVLSSKVDGATNPPPAVFAFAPATGMEGTSVTITGMQAAPRRITHWRGVGDRRRNYQFRRSGVGF